MPSFLQRAAEIEKVTVPEYVKHLAKISFGTAIIVPIVIILREMSRGRAMPTALELGAFSIGALVLSPLLKAVRDSMTWYGEERKKGKIR